ncbi:MAG: hypothetical protein JOY64_29665, partial [Alphaproteobacteria bacterium]|nr:hypothetical protein [Alphaproteobacteria bacterium]
MAATRWGFAALCFALAALAQSVPAAALDCANKPSHVDDVICGSAELEQASALMWGSIQELANFADEKEMSTLVADQNRWLAEWVQSCDAANAPAGLTACLIPKSQPRYQLLESRRLQIAGDRYSEPYDLGGLSLAISRPEGRSDRGDLFISNMLVAKGIYRLEPRARFRHEAVDALAFVANGGGAGYICANFPVYVVAVRPDRTPEVVRVPAKLDNRRDDACIAASRTPKGFKFTAEPSAGNDGWWQEWTPEDGLLPPHLIAFAPVPGTTMTRDLGDPLVGPVRNEQFYAALSRFSREGRIPLVTLTHAFAFAWEQHIDDPPSQIRIFNGCSSIGGPGRCYNTAEAKALYDP